MRWPKQTQDNLVILKGSYKELQGMVKDRLCCVIKPHKTQIGCWDVDPKQTIAHPAFKTKFSPLEYAEHQ